MMRTSRQDMPGLGHIAAVPPSKLNCRFGAIEYAQRGDGFPLGQPRRVLG